MMRALLPPARRLGPAVIVGLAAAWAVLWFAAEPPGQPATAYLGQFFGAESVLLLSIALVLISTLPWVEGVFDGIDRAAIWHRPAARSRSGSSPATPATPAPSPPSWT
jgi:hypothetical protein